MMKKKLMAEAVARSIKNGTTVDEELISMIEDYKVLNEAISKLWNEGKITMKEAQNLYKWLLDRDYALTKIIEKRVN